MRTPTASRWSLYKKIAVFGLGGVVLIALAVGIYATFSNNQKKATNEEKVVVDLRPVSFESNLLFTGNIYWGRNINKWAQETELGFKHPFSRLHEFERENYNAWISGLECPLVAGVHLTPAQENATLSFNCSPDYLEEASKWFDILTLANNHTDNQGVEGFAETKRHLEDHGIQYFGHYDPRAHDDLCDVISVPVTVLYSDSKKDKFFPIAFCGYHGVFRAPTDAALAVMKKYSEYMPVIAMPHMGAEYQPAPDQLKTSIYRKMIDNGADMVIGDHPHWVQTTEAYKGKPIIYSMGNFIFDQLFNNEVSRSAAINVLVKSINADRDQLEKWLDLAEDCKVYKDDCLEQAAAMDLKKLELTFAYDAIPTSIMGRVVHPVAGEQAQSIMDRLRWDATMKNLEYPHMAKEKDES